MFSFCSSPVAMTCLDSRDPHVSESRGNTSGIGKGKTQDVGWNRRSGASPVFTASPAPTSETVEKWDTTAKSLIITVRGRWKRIERCDISTLDRYVFIFVFSLWSAVSKTLGAIGHRFAEETMMTSDSWVQFYTQRCYTGKKMGGKRGCVPLHATHNWSEASLFSLTRQS